MIEIIEALQSDQLTSSFPSKIRLFISVTAIPIAIWHR